MACDESWWSFSTACGGISSTRLARRGLARFASRAQSFAAHRSMFPSATRVVSASFATGCTPARHELQGNTLALMEEGRLVYHDAGHPEFLQHKRRVTGRSLAVPTLAERLAPHGGMIMFSNVSPGAAYAHDPDGHGHVYHRAGSFAPGRKRLEGAQALEYRPGRGGRERHDLTLHRRGAGRAQAAAGDHVDGRAGCHAARHARWARPSIWRCCARPMPMLAA